MRICQYTAKEKALSTHGEGGKSQMLPDKENKLRISGIRDRTDMKKSPPKRTFMMYPQN